MKLIKVEAKGFKSFANKTTISFDGGIVGIVGPNGSGKSNVIDAIKWVLGEQSSKSLRGDTMEDVIFSGSKSVSALKTAEVTLTFDNSDGKVSLPQKYIAITRRLTRGTGSNLYFINGQPVRLKDIKEIAMETGISKSSSAIISQGTISNISQATPEERRGIFEESAGISKYNSRKKEALKKLTKTTENLEKIRTVLYELESQIKPLKKQSEKAVIYLEKKSQLKNVEIGLLVKDIVYFNNQLNNTKEEIEKINNTKEELETTISASENSIDQNTKYKFNLEKEIFELNEKFNNINKNINSFHIRDSIISQRRQMIIDGQIKETEAAKQEAMNEQLNELSKKIIQYKSFVSKLEKNMINKKEKILEQKNHLNECKSKQEFIKNKLLQVQTKINILEDNKKNQSYLFKGTKTIFQNRSSFPGFCGIVVDILDMDPKYIKPIENILKSTLQNIVVDNSRTAIDCVNFLKRNRGGVATFIPLDSIKPKFIRKDYQLAIDTQPSVVGIASDLVSVAPKFEVLKNFLLGNIVVTENIESATNLSKILEQRYMIVSLDGDIVHLGGVISGGEKGNQNNILGIDQKIKKLRDFQPVVQEELNKINFKLNYFFNNVTEQQQHINAMNVEIEKIKEKILNTKEQYYFLKDKYELSTSKKFKSSDQQNVDLDSKDSLEHDKTQIEISLKVKKNKIIAINELLSYDCLTKSKLEKQLREVINTFSKLQTNKNQFDFYIKSSAKRLSEEYQMTIETASNDFALTMNIDEARNFVNKKKKEISEIGHVNLDSIENYKTLNERYQKIQKAEQEIFNAQETIFSAINKMDQIIITKLDETINATRKEFQKVFETMFGGGIAKIKYTDPDNLLETGIEIIAQPPGKSVRNINLFSGGEKAIIAISLLFAILKIKPLPLCILDEVEAALDEANVIRYAQFLQSLKSSTQFIIVTHRLATMQNVDHLFGATMQKDGVTSFFSVKIENAKKLIS